MGASRRIVLGLLPAIVAVGIAWRVLASGASPEVLARGPSAESGASGLASAGAPGTQATANQVAAQVAPQAPKRPRALPDEFYPGFDAKQGTLPAARDGGRVVVHLLSFPRSLNFMIENSSVTRRMWNELHESLIRQDWESWEYVPALAESFRVLDQLVLAGGDPASGEKALVGTLGERDGKWTLARDGATSGKPEEFAKAEGVRALRGTVFDFTLRQGVKWQDGADFDARDVLFSFACFRNPFVRCGEKRFQFDKIARVESDSPFHVRFVFREPYFLAHNVFEGLTILPAHLYDLSDPRNPDHKEGASAEEQGRFVEEHPANRKWVGLGPYRLVEWSDTAIVARRWDGYWDRANGGHVDEIVWRKIADDGAAITALGEGELDYFDRLTGEDYFGGRTDNDAFRARFYKGYSYGPQITYTAWNMRRAKLADVRVRTALAMCFDWDGFIASYYKGLAVRVTGEQYVDGSAYDKSLAPLPFDLERARALLADAGWYDRDQDGFADQNGARLSIELLYPSGNKTSELSAQLWKENLAKAGVELTLAAREWGAMQERVRARDFDAISMGWITPFVVDPEQAWHSKWAGKDSANHSGLADPEIDRLIEEIQRETDPARQKVLFANLQRRIYALQPYAFGVNVPRKFAMAKRVRNLQCFTLDPGYSIRRWFVVEPAAGAK